MNMIDTLMEITIYSVVIFVSLFLLKRVFSKKMSPALHYALWFVLIARLMLPVTIDSGFHLFTLPDTVSALSIPATNMQAQPVQPTDIADANMLPVPSVQADDTVSDTPTLPTPTIKKAAEVSLQQVILLIWGAGVVACCIWLTVLYASLLRRIRRNRAKPAKKLVALLEEVKAELGIHAKIKLICLYEYGTPALLFPNIVLMPIDALAAMNAEQVKYALRHELTHYKRGDQIIGLLLSVLNAVYWFNPVVWVAFHMMRADMETACDAMVTRRLTKVEKDDYACLILNLFAQPEHRQIVLGMAQSSTRKMAEQRIRGIFMRKSSKPVAKVICGVMVIAMLGGCFTTACVPTERKAKETGNTGNPSNGIVHLSDHSTFYDNLLSVTIDADVGLPTASMLPVYRMVDREFTAEQVAAMMHVLLKKPLTNAVEFDPASSFIAYADLGQAKSAELSIPHYEERGISNCMYFENGMSYLLDGYQSDGQLPLGVSVTREEALELAEQLVRELGAENMQLAHVGRSYRGDGDEYDIASDAYRNTQCHLLIYTRTVDGIPTLTDFDSTMQSVSSGEMPDYTRYFERIYIAVDDSGVRNMAWLGHKDIAETVLADTNLFPLEKLSEQITNAVAERYASLTVPETIQSTLRWESASIVINRLSLNYVACITENGDYLLKPMWDCLGTSDMRMNPDEVAVYNLDHPDSNLNWQQYIDSQQNVICTIDAQTGEFYDKHWGMYYKPYEPYTIPS